MHQAASVGAGGEGVLAVGVLPVHQHPHHPAHIGGVLFGGDPVLEIDQPLEVPVLLLFCHRVGHFRRRRPLPGGVDKGEEGVIAHLLQQGEGVLKLLGGLSGEAHNDVRGEDDIRNQRPEPADLVQIGRPVVVPVHGLEHPVVARLHRQVELGGHLLAPGHGLKQLLGGVLGMAGHKANQKISGDGVDPLQQVGKIHVQPQILAVGVDVLAQEGDVLIPLLHQLPHLGEDQLRVTAPLPAPDVGDDAVSAEVVAAVHNGDPGLQLALPGHRQALGDVAGGVGGLKDPLTLVQHLAEQLGELPQDVGAKDQIHMPEGLLDLLRHMGLLHGAAAQADDLAGLALFRVGQGAHIAQHPHLRVLPDGAGVDDDDVRLLLVLGKAVAHLGQHAPELLRVRLVLLTAIGVHHGQGLLGELRDASIDLLPDLLLAPELLRGNQHVVSFHRSTSYRRNAANVHDNGIIARFSPGDKKRIFFLRREFLNFSCQTGISQI